MSFINWDQSGINYNMLVSQWTVTKQGVEIAGVTDKHQITGVFTGRLARDFLPVQLIYLNLFHVHTFPDKWHIAVTPNHSSNDSTVVEMYK